MKKYSVRILLILLAGSLAASLFASEFLNTGYITGGLGGVAVSGHDLSAGPRDFEGQFAILWDGGIGYQLENGVEIGLGYRRGPERYSESSDTQVIWDFQQQTLFATLGYNLPLGRSGLIGLGLAAGPSWIRGTITNNTSGVCSICNIRANNVSWIPEFRGEVLLGGYLGLGAGLGWHFSTYKDVRWEILPDIFLPLSYSSGEPVVLKNTGFLGRIYIKLYFKELL